MTRTCLSLALLAAFGSAGCRSPYYADRGALFGGLTGAGVGALVGEANGNAGAGAVIGSAIGAVTGAAVGEGIDADLARSRAEIEARMGRQMQGAVTVARRDRHDAGRAVRRRDHHAHSRQRRGPAAGRGRLDPTAEHGRPRRRDQRHAADAAARQHSRSRPTPRIRSIPPAARSSSSTITIPGGRPSGARRLGRTSTITTTARAAA